MNFQNLRKLTVFLIFAFMLSGTFIENLYAESLGSIPAGSVIHLPLNETIGVGVGSLYIGSVTVTEKIHVKCPAEEVRFYGRQCYPSEQPFYLEITYMNSCELTFYSSSLIRKMQGDMDFVMDHPYYIGDSFSSAGYILTGTFKINHREVAIKQMDCKTQITNVTRENWPFPNWETYIDIDENRFVGRVPSFSVESLRQILASRNGTLKFSSPVNF